MQRQSKRERMARLIDEAEQSDLSLAEFARRRGIPPQTLYWWRSRVRRDETALVPVTIVPVHKSSIRIEVGDATVIVERGFDTELLADIVRALGSC